jgi:hypothetical protein
VIGSTVDPLVADGDMVAAVWTGTLPGGAEIGKGLSLYRTSGGLLRSTPARPDRDHALVRILWSAKAARAARTGQPLVAEGRAS